ncbi:MAG TPA: M28 family peptidase [Blastocatellia bacterium]|nr:M28 family peptidase [Blastocatellia bacterium]
MNTLSPRRLSLRALIAALAVIQLAAPLSLAQTAAAKSAPAFSAAEREAASQVKAETIRDVTLALTAKEMQGRGTAQPGGDRAAQYIADRFAKLGLKPLGDQVEGKAGFLQPIKFKAEQVQPDASFKVGDVSLKYKDDFVIPPPLPQDPSKEASGPLAFVGYGVVSPDVKRDDLAGVDVKGKIVVVLTGRPNNVEAAAWSKVAGQQTVFGRLIGAGAAGFVIVYTAARVTQPFSLAAAYLSRRRVSPADAQGFPIKLPPIVLVSDAAVEKLFAGTGATFADLKAKAQAGEFVSRDLNKPATVSLRLKREEATSSNVVGMLEGADAALKQEAVVYSAHYDAYGIEADGTIYPGAADNALGVGKLVAIAEAFAKAKAKPRRSIIFLAVTGEEYGLLGAEYWVKHPTWPLEKVAADINFDGIGTEAWGELHYLVNYGAEHSELGQTVADVVAAMGGEIMADPFPEEAVFYRSDHYAFVKRGVPAVSPISAPAGDVNGFKERAAKWLITDYHMATDTVQKDWSWKGAQQLSVVGLVAGMRVANQDAMPAWVSSSPFNRPRGTTQPPPRQ